MAIKRQRGDAYGLSQPILSLSPEPIVAQRAPKTNDYAQLGTIWLDQPGSTSYVLVKIVANVATWQSFSGDAVFDDITVTGVLTVAGDYIQDGGVFQVTTLDNVANAILLQTNGGTSETIVINAGQSTSSSAVEIEAATGGIALVAGKAIANAISLDATAGGVAITAADAIATAIVLDATAGGVEIVGAIAAANAIVINASNAAGGLQLLTGGGELLLNTGATGNILLEAATSTIAGPAETLDARVGYVIFTGLTTAAAAAQVFTITNAFSSTISSILVTVANTGANDAQMTCTRVNPGNGSFTVTALNNGAASLNGNVIISWMFLN
jgi:hypothetical protein